MYTGYWRLFDPKSGCKFGPRAWVKIDVPFYSTSNSPLNDTMNNNNNNYNTKSNKRKHIQDNKKDKKLKIESDTLQSKRIMDEDHSDSDSDSDVSDGIVLTNDHRLQSSNPQPLDMMLNMLDRMGFKDVAENTKLLKQHNGDIDSVVQLLISKMTLDAQPENTIANPTATTTTTTTTSTSTTNTFDYIS